MRFLAREVIDAERRQRQDDDADGDEGSHERKLSHTGAPLDSEWPPLRQAERRVLVVATDGDSDRGTRRSVI